jgi:hypothetical protein
MTTTQTTDTPVAASSPYKDDWAGGNWSNVQSDFRMTDAQPEEVLVAAYGYESYEGSAHVLYRQGGSYFYASGSHCSCYGLEDQWEPEEYSLETLIEALERSNGGMYGFCGREGQDLLPTLRQRLKRRLARDRKKERAKAVS